LHVSGAPGRAAADQLAQLEHDGISNPVKDAVARTLTAHQAGIEEDLQMLRYVRLISVQAAGDLVDGHSPALQCLQDAQAAGFSKYLESPGYQVDCFFVHRRLLSGRGRDFVLAI